MLLPVAETEIESGSSNPEVRENWNSIVPNPSSIKGRAVAEDMEIG
jgi:hypothetical protein